MHVLKRVQVRIRLIRVIYVLTRILSCSCNESIHDFSSLRNSCDQSPNYTSFDSSSKHTSFDRVKNIQVSTRVQNIQVSTYPKYYTSFESSKEHTRKRVQILHILWVFSIWVQNKQVLTRVKIIIELYTSMSLSLGLIYPSIHTWFWHEFNAFQMTFLWTLFHSWSHV